MPPVLFHVLSINHEKNRKKNRKKKTGPKILAEASPATATHSALTMITASIKETQNLTGMTDKRPDGIFTTLRLFLP